MFKLMDVLFGCPHKRRTFPISTRPGQKRSEAARITGTYVVCLDCGKQFEYNLDEMRMGKAIDHSHDAGVVPPNLPTPRKTRIKYALLAAVPAAVVLASMLKGKDRAAKPKNGDADATTRHPSDRRAE